MNIAYNKCLKGKLLSIFDIWFFSQIFFFYQNSSFRLHICVHISCFQLCFFSFASKLYFGEWDFVKGFILFVFWKWSIIFTANSDPLKADLVFSRALELLKHYVSRSFLILSSLYSSPKMVAISFCIKAQGTSEPTRGHLFLLGQYTSLPAPWSLILSREQGKQNLCSGTDGHWTKCVSSRRWLQIVHFRDSVLGTVDSGIVLPTPLSDTGGAWLGRVFCGLLFGEWLLWRRPWERTCAFSARFGEADVRLSVTFMRAAIGDGPPWPTFVFPSGGVGVKLLLIGDTDVELGGPDP